MQKKDTSRLFLNAADGGLYDRIYTVSTIPEQVIAAFRTMDAIVAERKRREAEAFASGTSIPNWIPHSDHFMAGLLFLQAFNRKMETNPAYLLKFAQWISQPANTGFQSRYKSIMKGVDKIVQGEAKNYGYSHPRFFKTQPEYDGKLRLTVTVNPIK